MHSQTWKQLERDVSTHFGVKRNIKRGADFGIEDTDVDVFAPENAAWGGTECFIIDCKHDQRAEGLVRAVAERVRDNPGTHGPSVVWVMSDVRTYRACRMADFTPTYRPSFAFPEQGWHNSWVMRAGTVYLNEWFDKLDTVYLPKKAQEFKVLESQITSLVAIRVTGIRETLIVERIL